MGSGPTDFRISVFQNCWALQIQRVIWGLGWVVRSHPSPQSACFRHENGTSSCLGKSEMMFYALIRPTEAWGNPKTSVGEEVYWRWSMGRFDHGQTMVCANCYFYVLTGMRNHSSTEHTSLAWRFQPNHFFFNYVWTYPLFENVHAWVFDSSSAVIILFLVASQGKDSIPFAIGRSAGSLLDWQC